MEYQIKKDTNGIKEIDFGPGRSVQGFYQLAQKLENILDIRFHTKQNDFNTFTWRYAYMNVPFALHHDWFSGTKISIESIPSDREEEQVLEEMAALIKPF
ncbi:MAG: hypothetical protein ACKVPJ_12595 [Chitinophagales bacterium]